MNDQRWRSVHTLLSILTVCVLLVLLVYTVSQFQRIAIQRADAAEEAAERNQELLHQLAEQATAIRDSQTAARAAFKVLARRNEQLHGNDPDDAPDFPLTNSDVRSDEQGHDRAPASEKRDQRKRDEPRRDAPKEPDEPARRDPRPTPRPTPSPSPSPSPEGQVCVPLTNVCLDSVERRSQP